MQGGVGKKLGEFTGIPLPIRAEGGGVCQSMSRVNSVSFILYRCVSHLTRNDSSF